MKNNYKITLSSRLISRKRITITYYDLRFEQSINRVQSNEEVFRPQRSSALDARRPRGRHRPRVFGTQRVENSNFAAPTTMTLLRRYEMKRISSSK